VIGARKMGREERERRVVKETDDGEEHAFHASKFE